MFENDHINLILFAVVFLGCAGSVLRWRQGFWSGLIFFSILGVGPAMDGYAILDEVALGGLLLGALVRLLREKPRFDYQRITSLHFSLFLLFVGYLLFQSVRSILDSGDVRMMRYVVLYVMILATTLCAALGNFTAPSSKNLLRLALFSASLYAIFYIAHGMYHERLYNVGTIGRFLSQGQLWTGSAYAVYPIVIGTAAAILSRGKVPLVFRLVGLALLFWMGVYFDSRSSLLMLIFFLVLSQRVRLIALELAGTFGTIALLWVLFPSLVTPVYQTAKVNLVALGQSSAFLVAPRASDADRQGSLLAGWDTLRQHSSTMVYGRGFYSYRKAMIPALQDMGSPISLSGIIRPTGLPALMVDTGLLGLFLLFLNLALACYAISTQVDNALGLRGRILLFACAASICWLAVSNILDVVLLFVLVMPAGLWFRMAQAETPPERRLAWD